jgi:hypothetical protein
VEHNGIYAAEQGQEAQMRALVLSMVVFATTSATSFAQSPAKTDDAVKQCIEGIAIPGATPARNLKVGLVNPDPKLHDVTWTRPDSTRGRQFQLRKAIETAALVEAVKKCEQ